MVLLLEVRTTHQLLPRERHVRYNTGSEAMESVLKLARQACF